MICIKVIPPSAFDSDPTRTILEDDRTGTIRVQQNSSTILEDDGTGTIRVQQNSSTILEDGGTGTLQLRQNLLSLWTRLASA